MADPILHIKDSFYFEVPKFLCPAHYVSRTQFPEVWGQLDPEFQDWEFARLHAALVNLGAEVPSADKLQHDWHHWQHADHANDGKPFDTYLSEMAAVKSDHNDLEWFQKLIADPVKAAQWKAAAQKAGSWAEYIGDSNVPEWDRAKIEGYNQNLSGKILIPQFFGAKLRNLYEAESGIAISRFMIVEVAVALILIVIFSWLARRIQPGSSPKGRAWNLLEVFFVFIRDEIAKPALGGHDHDHDHVEHVEHFEGPDVVERHGISTHERGHGPGEPDHHAGHGHHGHAEAAHHDPATAFTPLLCTIFFFILGCNLAGMVPWVGSPTGTWGVTFGMALVTFATVVVAGMRQFGVVGFFLNQIPTMDMHPVMGAILKPMIFAIELMGLLIKHAVLSVRLLANMVAGHLVLLAILGLAFGAQAALQFQGDNSWLWWITAPIAVVGCTLLSLLELFVAFLQAYVFTLLSALFIGASIHKH